jgi:hypothetical protein
MNKRDIVKMIDAITSGEDFGRNDFPENRKGRIAKDLWYDGAFSLGMEYGALLILLKLEKEVDNDE